MPVQRELITMITFGIDTSASDARADSISRSFFPYPFSRVAKPGEGTCTVGGIVFLR